MRPSTGSCIATVLECSTPPTHLVYSACSFSDTSHFCIDTSIFLTNFLKMTT